jgi:hypothetical protein
MVRDAFKSMRITCDFDARKNKYLTASKHTMSSIDDIWDILITPNG